MRQTHFTTLTSEADGHATNSRSILGLSSSEYDNYLVLQDVSPPVVGDHVVSSKDTTRQEAQDRLRVGPTCNTCNTWFAFDYYVLRRFVSGSRRYFKWTRFFGYG